jgi:hypothetical protein
MAPRDPLPLTLPAQPVTAEDAAEDAEDEIEEVDERFADLDPFERGPEITEIR